MRPPSGAATGSARLARGSRRTAQALEDQGTDLIQAQLIEIGKPVMPACALALFEIPPLGKRLDVIRVLQIDAQKRDAVIVVNREARDIPRRNLNADPAVLNNLQTIRCENQLFAGE